jgi:hypothetical protein
LVALLIDLIKLNRNLLALREIDWYELCQFNLPKKFKYEGIQAIKNRQQNIGGYHDIQYVVKLLLLLDPRPERMPR